MISGDKNYNGVIDATATDVAKIVLVCQRTGFDVRRGVSILCHNLDYWLIDLQCSILSAYRLLMTVVRKTVQDMTNI